MKNVKIGYPPLYLKLYDDTISEIRPRIDAFNAKLIGMFENKGLELVKAPVCRIKKNTALQGEHIISLLCMAMY